MYLSIIIPTYNEANIIGSQLTALQNQDYDGPWEVIVVDNRSTDHLHAVVAEFQRQMTQLSIVEANEHQGRAYAVNTGVSAARGDALLFCDADDIVAPGWLAAMARALHEHPVVAGALDVITLNGDAPWRPPPRTGTTAAILNFLPHASGCNSGVWREAFDTVGGFTYECEQAQDVDFSWRLQLKGYQIYDVPDAVVYYRYRRARKRAWWQLFKYARAHVWLYRRYASHGMPRPSGARVIRRYGRLVRGLPRLLVARRQARQVDHWLADLATTAGHIAGSWEYRRWYL